MISSELLDSVRAVIPKSGSDARVSPASMLPCIGVAGKNLWANFIEPTQNVVREGQWARMGGRGARRLRRRIVAHDTASMTVPPIARRWRRTAVGLDAGSGLDTSEAVTVRRQGLSENAGLSGGEGSGPVSVCGYMTFPQQHRTKLHSTSPIERLNGEIRRRTDVVGIFPNEASIRRLVGAILMEQTEEWTVQRGRFMTPETLAPVCEDLTVSLPAAQRD